MLLGCAFAILHRPYRLCMAWCSVVCGCSVCRGVVQCSVCSLGSVMGSNNVWGCIRDTLVSVVGLG